MTIERQDRAEIADRPLLEAWQVRFASRMSDPAFLVGFVTGHPRLPGRRRSIHTSPLIHLDWHGRSARTQSRSYRLGPPISRLEYPDANRGWWLAVPNRSLRQTEKDGAWLLTIGAADVACFPALSFRAAFDVLLDFDADSCRAGNEIKAQAMADPHPRPRRRPT